RLYHPSTRGVVQTSSRGFRASTEMRGKSKRCSRMMGCMSILGRHQHIKLHMRGVSYHNLLPRTQCLWMKTQACVGKGLKMQVFCRKRLEGDQSQKDHENHEVERCLASMGEEDARLEVGVLVDKAQPIEAPIIVHNDHER